jgi:hypothetical protein
VVSETERTSDENIEVINEQTLPHRKFSLFSKDMVFVEEDIYLREWGSMPHTHILINRGDRKDLVKHEFRHFHWYLAQDAKPYAMLFGGEVIDKPWDIKNEVMDSLRKSWAGELSWRVKRVHELSMAAGEDKGRGSKGYYLASMHALMPPHTQDSKYAWFAMKKIGQVALTSILSSILKGVTPELMNKEDKTAISHGLEEGDRSTRYSSLPYQHRMHPEISSIPRQIFYKGEALLDDDSMKMGGRDWDYDRYQNRRTLWYDVKGPPPIKNTNRREADIVLQELAEFVRWVKSSNAGYTAVLLSFYEKQRKLIRDLLRDRYPNNSRKETRFDIEGVQVRNYTVDKVQGQEGDLVILSMVQNRRVGFMDSPNRLNVAITRAKYQLIVVGDREYFLRQGHSPELQMVAEAIKPWPQRGFL